MYVCTFLLYLQLGYKPGDPLTVEVVSKVDQMHYHGTKAVDEAVAILGIR